MLATGCAGVVSSAEYDAKTGRWTFSVRGIEQPVVGVAVPAGSTPEQAIAAFAIRQSGGSAEAGRQACVRAARLIASAGSVASTPAGDSLIAAVLAHAAAAEKEAPK